MSSLLFGSTLFSFGVITALSFVGFSLGSHHFGNQGSRTKNPLGVYGRIELVIAGWALASPLIYGMMEYLFTFVYTAVSEMPVVLRGAQSLLMAGCILIPAFCMGGVVPLSVAYGSRKHSTRHAVALISGLHALGGFCGVFLTAGVFLPTLGVGYLFLLCGVVHLAFVFMLLRRDTPSAPVAPRGYFGNENHAVSGPPLLLLAVFFILGIVGITSEVLWVRFMDILIQNSVYTYATVMAVAILGFSAGNMASLLFQKKMGFRGLSILLMLLALYHGSFLFLPPEMILPFTTEQSLFSLIWLSFLLFFMPTCVMGLSFPVAVALYTQRNGGQAGVATGRILAADSLGTVVGVLGAGGVFLALWGVRGLTQGALVLSMGAALLCVVGIHPSRRIFTGGVFILVLSFLIYIHQQWETALPHGYVDTHGGRLTALYESPHSLMSVIDYRGGNRELYSNNLWQGEKQKNRQIMAAHVPMILAQDARKIALVGTGVGQTAQRFLYYPVDSLYCIDIEQDIEHIITTHFPRSWAADDRVRFFSEDGRSFFRHRRRTFDLISLEAGQVFRPGVAHLYTREFYEDLYTSLNEGGVVSQFIPLASFNYEYYQRVIQSFIEVFPHAVLWYNDAEFLLVGRKGGAFTNVESSFKETVERIPMVFRDLAYSHYGGPAVYLNQKEPFFAGFLAGPEELAAIAGDVPVLRDRRPELAYYTGRNQQHPFYLDSIQAHLAPPQSLLGEMDVAATTRIERYRQINLQEIIANILYITYTQTGDMSMLEAAYRANPLNMTILTTRIEQALEAEEFGRLAKYYQNALETAPENLQFLYMRAVSLHRNGDYQEALDAYERTLAVDESHVSAWNNAGVILEQMGEYERARSYYRQAISTEPGYRDARVNLSRLQRKMVAEEES
ncbi:fused MFS/spermidine synthase [Chitinivibrio alkaliphilus]|nr:fused MFS/spermidine synthase [Chitinivibrio alkaliphilus]